MNNLINKLKFIIKSSRFYLVVFCFVLIILLIFSFNKIGNLIYVYFQSTNNVIHDEIKVDRSLNYILVCAFSKKLCKIDFKVRGNDI